MICATTPLRPDAPTTVVEGDKLAVYWTAPSEQGIAITAYQVLVRQSDLVFSEELINCDASDAAIVSALKCQIPLSSIYASPYSLVQGNDIYAKVVAINFYGSSETSLAGNGAKVVKVPDAPTSLANNPSVTSMTQIGFSWTVINDGGKPI